MMPIQKLLAVCLLLGSLIGGGSALAQDTAPAPNTASAVPNQTTSGDALCTRCHDESEAVPILSIYQTKHGVKGDSRTPNCQSCHGASNNHLKNKASAPEVTFGKNKADSKEQEGACLVCHRSDSRSHWKSGLHQVNDVSCSNCHVVHAAVDRVRNKKTQAEVCFACHKEQRADSNKISHHPIGEGKVVCSDCHNPHGSAGPKMLKENTVLETCFSCHAEKRGPFLWEHQPATKDCTLCHTAHGSNITPLLKSRAPFMCDECHSGPHNSPVPYGPGAAIGRPGAAFIPGTSGEGGITSAAGYGDRSAAGRSCINCHSMIHGSNSPSGAFLHR